jgi:hypothetical protein
VLVEPSEDEKELDKHGEILRRLRLYFGSDKMVAQYAAVLRVPGTLNVKYKPPRPVKVNVLYPERQYSIMDFEEYLPEEPEPAPRAPATPGEGSQREAPGKELPKELALKLATLLSDIWTPGYRHRLALYVAGLLAYAGYDEVSARQLVSSVGTLTKDEELEGRLNDVGTTYQRFASDQSVTGAPTLEKMIEEEFSPEIQPKARRAFRLVKATIPKTKNKEGGPTPNFELIRIEKYDSRPARFKAFLKMGGGAEATVETETGNFYWYHNFVLQAFEQANVALALIKQPRWQEMIAAAPMSIRAASKESTPVGAVDEALEEFLGDRKEKPDVGVLRSIPGYDDDGIYFKLTAFEAYMKRAGIQFTRQLLTNMLREQGWDCEMRRFGTVTSRIWYKVSENGQKDRDLFQAPCIPTPTPIEEKTKIHDENIV